MGKLARNNVEWLYHNGARYWEGFKKGVHKHPLPLLFTAFMFGETAAATLFHSMHQRTTVPALKEAFRCIGKDEARHLGICLALLQKVMPALSDEDKARVTKQLRAGFVFLSGVLYEPPKDFWELPKTFAPAHRLLEDVALHAVHEDQHDEALRHNDQHDQPPFSRRKLKTKSPGTLRCTRALRDGWRRGR